MVLLSTLDFETAKPNVMAVTWNMPVESEPPRIAVVLGKSSLSHELVKRFNEFVVNVPDAHLAKQVMLVGSTSGRETDKFKAFDLTRMKSFATKVPCVKECMGHLECRVFKSMEFEESTLFVADVLHARADRRYFKTHWELANNESGLLHHLGGALFGVTKGPEIKIEL